MKFFGTKTRGWSVGWAVGWVKALGLARVVVASSRWSKALNGWAGAVLVLIFGAAAESSPTWTGETVTSATAPCWPAVMDVPCRYDRARRQSPSRATD